MRVKFSILVIFLLAVLVLTGGCSKQTDQKPAGETDNRSGQNQAQDQIDDQATAANSQNQEESDNMVSNDNIQGQEIDQVINDILDQTEKEQTETDSEQADEGAVENDTNELNNLTQTYDEKEF